MALCTLVCTLVCALAGVGLAQAPEEDEREASERPGPPTMPPRPMPDYGRAPVGTDAGDAARWFPRILFAPVHLVIEYGLREPLRLVFRTIELERIDALFAGDGMPGIDGPERRWSFGLRARYDHGMLPSVGLALHARDAPDRHRLAVGVELWGIAQVRGFGHGRVVLDRAADESRVAESGFAGSGITDDTLAPPSPSSRDRTLLGLTLVGSLRTDGIHHGIGWQSPAHPRARYTHAFGELELLLETRFFRRSVLQAGARAGVHRFDTTSYRREGDRALDEAAASDALALPPGYEDGYTVVQPWVRLVVDTRETYPHGTGLRASLLGAWAIDAERGVGASWARVGGELEVSAEVLRERTLILRAALEVVAPLGRDPVPFTEQALLGGALDRMPGFLPGRLVDRSATTLGLAWRYAVWAWLDAELFVDVGNVFGAGFDDFDVERLRLSFGTALRTPDLDGFTLMVAAGTEPFALGAAITSGRFVVVLGAPP